MGMRQEVAALYINLLGANGNAVSGHTYDTLPDNDDTTATASTTADTFGNYSQIAASVGSATVWMCGVFMSGSSARTDYKVGVATGVSGSESDRVVVPYRSNEADAPYMAVLPYLIQIPSGTRLATRAKAGDTTGATIDVVAEIISGLQG